VSVEVWTRSQSTRTAAQLPLEVALHEAAPPPVYQLIAARAKQLSRLSLTNVQVARALGGSDKTAAKAIAWQAALSTQPPET
jgi:hypothetical protein